MMRWALEKPFSTNDLRAETRVLLVEDNIADARLIREMLSEPGNGSFVLETANRLSDAVTQIRDAPFDVVLLDLGLPDSQGLDTLKTFLKSAVEIPVVVLTGLADDAISVQAVEGGAQDYLVKGRIDWQVLSRVIRYSIGRKRQEADLFRAKYLLERTFSSLHEAVFVIHPPGRTIVACNPSVKRVFGYEVEEVVGRDAEFLHVDRRMYEEFVNKTEQAFKEEGLFNTEYRMKRKDGTFIHTDITVTAILKKGDRLPGAVTVVRDITERKSLEDQLRQAQKMEAVGEFASGIAHDFNSLLAVVLGFGELALMKMPEDARSRQDIEQIVKAANQGTLLTRNLLAFSRKQELHREPVDLNGIVLRIEKFLSGIIGGDVRIKVLPHIEELSVLADAGQVEQILVNLATNARDAMPGGGTFTMKTDRVELDEAFIRDHRYGRAGLYGAIVVSDTGNGMDEATVKRIFEPFFTTKEAGKGTGLGLSIVYGIIKQHDGFIDVCSEIGKGTTFRICLPLIREGENG